MTTMLNEPKTIMEALDQLNNLQECVLLYVAEAEYGMTWRFGFHYIWEKPDVIRQNLKDVILVELTFGLVQELRYAVRLNRWMVHEPERVNWGLREVAQVRLVPDSPLVAVYRDLPRPFHHVEFLWESDNQRIDVVFSHLTVSEPVKAGRFEGWEERMKKGLQIAL